MARFNRFNLSQMLAGASQALNQAVQYHGAMDIENLRSQRAENLARLQHEFNVELQQRELAGQQKLESQRIAGEGAIETSRETAMLTREEQMQEAYMSRLQTQQRLQEELQQRQLSSEEQRQIRQQINANRQQMELELRDMDSQRTQAATQLSEAAARIPGFSFMTPEQKNEAIIADPTTGPLLDTIHKMDQDRARAVARFTVYGASLGDPAFQGVSTEDLQQLMHGPTGIPGISSPAAGPSSPAPAGAGAGANAPGPMSPGPPTPGLPSNPHGYSPDNTSNLYPNPNPADDLPAIPAGSTASSAPGLAGPPPQLIPGMAPTAHAGAPASGGFLPWAPPTAPLGPTPSPLTSMSGPLRQPPQLIPQTIMAPPFGGASQLSAPGPLISAG